MRTPFRRALGLVLILLGAPACATSHAGAVSPRAPTAALAAPERVTAAAETLSVTPRPRRAGGVVAPRDVGPWSPRTLVAVILVLGGLAVVIGLSL